jgi:Holliday junction resolvase RusA-like endonuclease
LIIEGPLPPSSNNIYYSDRKTGSRHLTNEAKVYKKRLGEIIMLKGREVPFPEPPFTVDYHFRFPNRRKRDLSNCLKLLEDAVFAAIGQDDRYVNAFHVWKYIDKERPGFVMEIKHSPAIACGSPRTIRK